MDLNVELTANVAQTGWTYFRLDDPGTDRYQLIQAARNQPAPAKTLTVGDVGNAWTTHRLLPFDGAPTGREDRIHLLDHFNVPGPVSYTLTYVRLILNEPPVADIAVDQLTAVGADASVQLDGGLTSDPDHALTDLTFAWTVDGNVVCDGPQAECGLIEVVLSYGSHEVTLRVTDPDGDFDEVTKTITVDPAQLAVFALGDSKVEFNHTPPRIKLKGEIGLPFGLDYTDLDPQASVSLALAGVEILPTTLVTFAMEDGEADEWEYEASSDLEDIRKFKIDWKGMRFKFKEHGFPVKLKSDLITASETVLEIELKPEHVEDAFTIDIGGQAQISFTADGLVSAATVPFEVEEQDHGGHAHEKVEVTLTLPFALLDTTVITFSGGLTKVINVGDDLKGSVGRFHMRLNFDSALFPDGTETTPRTLDMSVSVGAQGYPGATSLGPDDLEVKNNKWHAK